jgi:MFS family permease
MTETRFRLYGYRWVVLATFMFANLAIQVLWIAYAPITGPAAQFYGVSDLQIGLLSMVFMIAFVPLSIPTAWVIDTYGFRVAVNIGVVLMAVFGILRGLAGESYTLVLISTIGIAIAQPFLLNAWTKVAARWFSLGERATAVGLSTMANLAGAALGMVLTPILILNLPIPTVQLAYGVLAAVSAVLFIAFARENPPTPPCPPGMETRALMLDGLKHALRVRPFLLYLAVAFIGMGLFNGLSTWIEAIVRPRGFSPTDAGTMGALLVVGGIIGAFILPLLSDKYRMRQRFMLVGMAGAVPGLIGITFAVHLPLLLVSAFSMGFFLASVYPIGMQYSAEVTYPTPEGTSNGLISLFGQGAVVFVFIMQAMRGPDGSFTRSLLLALALLLINVLIITRLRDAPGLRA